MAILKNAISHNFSTFHHIRYALWEVCLVSRSILHCICKVLWTWGTRCSRQENYTPPGMYVLLMHLAVMTKQVARFLWCPVSISRQMNWASLVKTLLLWPTCNQDGILPCLCATTRHLGCCWCYIFDFMKCLFIARQQEMHCWCSITNPSCSIKLSTEIGDVK